MVNADREVNRSRELLEIATNIRDRTKVVKDQLKREVERSKELQAEMNWLRFFEYSEPALDFLRRLDEQCFKSDKE